MSEAIEFDIRFALPRDLIHFERWMEQPETMHFQPFANRAEVEGFAKRLRDKPELLIGLTAFRLEKGVEEVLAIGFIFTMPYKKLNHQAAAQLTWDPNIRAEQLTSLQEAMVKNLIELATNPEYKRDHLPVELLDFELIEGSSLAPVLQKMGIEKLFTHKGFYKISGALFSKEFFQVRGKVAADLLATVPAVAPDEHLAKLPPSHVIRFTQRTEFFYLKIWFEEQPSVLPWFPMQTDLEIIESINYWAYFCSLGGGLTYLIDGKVVGMAILNFSYYQKQKHQALISIIVAPKARGKGVGRQLLYALEKLAKTKGLQQLHLEVYEGNPAIKLYLRSGYKVFGAQNRWTKENNSYLGKILMQKELEADGRA